MEPGSSLRLLPVIKLCCLAIIALSCTMIYKDIAAFHMYVLIFLACGLWGSVWFLTVALDEAGGPVSTPVTQAGKGGKENKSD
ncbi:hypothetical protein TrRE_jg10999 [Triparma retinervis]|uniref:Uncharacterized protein n=1 Tax=Triparma retinervis TaxID=2557542 RepID=A0A9W7E513_9STRA|nr:hypothetical protein TrRE_jg10999 [Triparma retinervis]